MNVLCDSYLKVSREVCSFLENVEDVGEESITDFWIWKVREINKKIDHVNTLGEKLSYQPPVDIS
jgi:hypothetical protein